MATYKVGYECKDGKRLYFMHETNRQLRYNQHGGGLNLNTNPLLVEIGQKVREKKEDSGSKMNQHGGYKQLRYIKNTKSGFTVTCDIW